jgi:hypothetical protein
MNGVSGGVYGGSLLALSTLTTLTFAREKGYPNVLSMQLDVFIGVPAGPVDISVRVIRQGRRLLFLRMDFSSNGKPTMASQAVCGWLVGQNSEPAKEILIGRYNLASSLAAAPSLRTFSDGIGGSFDVALGALGLPTKARGWAGDRYMQVTHSREATEYVRSVVERGRDAVRSESWEKVDAMPRLIRTPNPSGDITEPYLGFVADHFPLSTVLKMALGPNVPSVTTSISFMFYKPISPGTREMYMISDMPAEDILGAGELAVASSEARIYAKDGGLVAMMRQMRVNLGGEIKPSLGKELEGYWKARDGKGAAKL